MLNDVAHLAVRIGENSAIAGWVGQTRRQQRDIGTTAAVSLHEGIDRCGPQERHITVENEKFSLESFHHWQELLHRVARAVLGRLQHKFQTVHVLQRLFDAFGLVTNDQQAALRLQVLGAGENPFHQRCPRQGLQHFR